MARPLTAFLPLAGDGETSGLLLAPPGAWLPPGTVAAGPDLWWVPLRGAGVRRSVACTVGDPWHTGEGTWRALTWVPVPEDGDIAPMERLLPSFRGEVGVARFHGRDASLVLAGSYDVPAGLVGELVDAVILHRIAQRTGTAFLVDVSTSLRAHHPVGA